MVLSLLGCPVHSCFPVLVLLCFSQILSISPSLSLSLITGGLPNQYIQW